MPDGIPIPDANTVPKPGNGPQGDSMAATVDATIDKVLDQAFARTHEDAMAQMQRENAGAGLPIICSSGG